MKTIEHSNLSKPIYDTLKEMILNREFQPGQKIIQEKIAQQLGVSRTPLMKALQMLEHELLLESIPRRGIYVKKVSNKELVDLYFCRESIECMAIRLATERASKNDIIKLEKLFAPYQNQLGEINPKKYQASDEAFHNMIIELCDNSILEKMSRLSQIPNRVYSLGLLRTPGETLSEHLDMIQAMKTGDAVLAEQKMKDHIKLSREALYSLDE